MTGHSFQALDSFAYQLSRQLSGNSASFLIAIRPFIHLRGRNGLISKNCSPEFSKPFVELILRVEILAG